MATKRNSERFRRYVEVPCSSMICGHLYKVRPLDLARGTHRRFCCRGCRYDVIHGHRWKGGPVVTGGYPLLRGGVPEHIAVAELSLGHRLPEGAEVHHVNGVKHDNRPCNLVICQDAGYHLFLHALARVQKMGGRPFIDKICSKCKQPKPFSQFSPSPREIFGCDNRCKPCAAAQWRKRAGSLRIERVA